jgi:hypothetical protein
MADPQAEHVRALGLGRAAGYDAVAVEVEAACERNAAQGQLQVEGHCLFAADDDPYLVGQGTDLGAELPARVGPGLARRQELPGQEQTLQQEASQLVDVDLDLLFRLCIFGSICPGEELPGPVLGKQRQRRVAVLGRVGEKA